MVSQLDVREIQHYNKESSNIIVRSRVFVFLMGFCLGMMFFLWKKRYIVDQSGILGQELFEQLTRITFEPYELLKYIIKNRGTQFLMLTLIACSRRKNLWIGILLAYGGFIAAILLLTSVYHYNMKGIMLCLLMGFPHGICYLMFLCILFHKKEEDDTKYYHKSHEIREKGFYKILTKVVKWVVIIALFVLGVIVECYINPILVIKFSMLL